MDGQKVVLVTGSSSGFGRLMVETLAGQGYQVFASMRGVDGKNAQAGAELRALASEGGLPLRVVEIDVTRDASVEAGVREVIDRAGRIDVLVNNAAVLNMGPNEAFTLEQVQLLFDANFFGVVRMNRAVLPQMRRQGSGLLVHISSDAARLVVPFTGFYCASKAAMEALAETYRYDLSGLGIDSVIVEPGAFPTPVFDKAMQPADTGRVEEYGPVAKYPARVAAALVEIATAPHSPNPQEVADAVAKLIATPAGQRPLRTPIGLDAQAVVPLNELEERAQQVAMTELGMADLLRLSTGPLPG